MSIFIGSGSISNVLYSSGPGDIPTSGSFLQLQKNTFGGTSGSGPWTWPDNNGIVTDVIDGPLDSSGSVGWNFSGSTTIGIVSSSLVGYFNCSSSAEPFTIQFFGTLNNLAGAQALIGNPQYGESGFTKQIQFVSQSSSQMLVQFRPLVEGEARSVLVDYIAGNATGITITYNGSGSMYNASASVYQNGILKGSTEIIGGPFTIFCTGSGFDANGNKYVRLFRPASVPAKGNGLVGQVGSIYIWNRVLSDSEILSSYNFASNGGTNQAQTVYIGNELVFAAPTTTTTTTTTTTSTTTTRPPLSVLSLVVGGGGAGGVGTAGGGGAGGLRTGSFSLTASTYTVTVGNGGASSAGPVGLSISTQSGNPGETSSFSSLLVAFGGGGGFAYEGTQNTSNGGSGGGPSDTRLRQPAGGTVVLGGSGSSGQGNNGGTGTYGQQFGAGGGGASQVGQNGNAGVNPRIAGAGGSGSANTFRDGTSIFYAGGGGAGGYNTCLAGAGGFGGGGTGGGPSGGSGVTGSKNTGGGGGGSNRNVNGTVNGVGAGGGSGIVVIAYLTSSFSASAATAVSGGIITDFTSGSQVYRSHTFLSSSNLVIS